MSKLTKTRYVVIKVILVILNAVAVLGFMTSVSLLYSNSNFKAGITNLNKEVYEDSPLFMEQFSKDVQYAFDYIEYKDVFETDGKFDLDKVIFSVSDGPNEDTQYTIQDVITTARRRGYYLDENYQIMTAPNIVTSNQETKYTVNWTAYEMEREIDEPSDQYVTIDELIVEALTKLSKYYAAYDRLVANPTNFSYRIEYGSNIFTNNKALSEHNVNQFGRYAICTGDSFEIENNLTNSPTNLGYLLESSKYNSPGVDHKVAYVAVDTTYPAEDVYRSEALEYAMEREAYFRELLVTSISVIVLIVTLVLIVILAVRSRDNIAELSVFKGYNRSFEGRVFACALAIIVLLYLNENVFKRILHIYLPYQSWDFAERVTGYACIYACVVITAISILQSALAGNLWERSLLHRLFDNIDRYIDENSFGKRSTLVIIGVVVFELVVCMVTILLFVNEKTLMGRFAAIAMMLLGIVGNIVLVLWALKKSGQMDKIAVAISEIAAGKTNYQLNVEEFDGKEEKIAKDLNSLSAGLDRAINEKVKSERMKADLITNVSHDIKTPLTSIINYVDLIKREHPTDPKICEYLEVLDQKSQHLKHLTEDLVEASKVSSGNVNLQIMDLDFVEMVQQANGEFEEKFATRGLSIVSTYPKDETGAVKPLMIKADGASLWRVLENLYNNAFKYAMENSRIYVDMQRCEDGRAEFVMKNISARALNIGVDELTERFVRGDVSRTTEGSGLGLSIATSLTRLQGGSFSIQIDGDLFKAIVRM